MLVMPKNIPMFAERQRSFDIVMVFPYDISACDYYMQLQHPDETENIDVTVDIDIDNYAVSFSLTWQQTEALLQDYYNYDILQIDGTAKPKTICKGKIHISDAITLMGT